MTTYTAPTAERPSTTTPAAASSSRQAPRDQGPVLGRLLLSEWTKLRSLRSTWVALALAASLGLGLAALVAVSVGAGGGPGDEFGADTVASVLTGTGFAGLVLGVLGALQMSGEYATGTIAVSLTAVPRRWTLLVAKALVLVAVVAPLSVAMSGGAVLVADAVVDAGVAFSWEAVLGNAAYLTAVALLGLGLATVVRGTAMSITVLVSLVFVLPPLVPLLPWSWVQTAADYSPAVAGQSLVTTLPGVAVVGDVAALWTLAAWTLVPLAAGAIRLTRRDA
jgi:ABC-type transport system involved in multi-copper enzyme maturation permease subunit